MSDWSLNCPDCGHTVGYHVHPVGCAARPLTSACPCRLDAATAKTRAVDAQCVLDTGHPPTPTPNGWLRVEVGRTHDGMTRIVYDDVDGHVRSAQVPADHVLLAALADEPSRLTDFDAGDTQFDADAADRALRDLRGQHSCHAECPCHTDTEDTP